MTAGEAIGAPGRETPHVWWERRAFLLLLPLLAALPLLLPALPPLTDLPGHMGRYKIALDLSQSPALQQFYEFRWALVPNLGADLLVVPLAAVFGLEGATKIVAMLIPALTTAGFLWVSKEAHGRVTPGVLLAVPLVYGFPFIYGFLNFTLSVAFAFLALGLWMRLGRLERRRLRAALFVPIALIVWVAHAFGWGMLGLLAFGAELARELDRGRRLPQAFFRAGLHVLPLAVPLVPMAIWSGETPNFAKDWFNLPWKMLAFLWLLRDRWQAFDIACVLALLLALVFAARDKRLESARALLLPALMLFAAFVLLPRLFLGGAHNDNRILPYAVATALLALRPSAAASRRFATGFALAALAFFLVRMGAAGASAWLYGREIAAEAQAIEKLPRGARVAAFVGIGCFADWRRNRLDHLPSLAIVRREAFANDQWTVAGSHLLTVKPPFTAHVDPTQMVAEPQCKEHVLGTSLAALPPGRFTHLWLIQPPAYDPALVSGLPVLWRRGRSVLFQLPPAQPSPPVTVP
ncbi:MAG TPA: hypothetical protein VGB70_10300 [Allosphingosinicella sp.]|jgi:hypothetical protein